MNEETAKQCQRCGKLFESKVANMCPECDADLKLDTEQQYLQDESPIKEVDE